MLRIPLGGKPPVRELRQGSICGDAQQVSAKFAQRMIQHEVAEFGEHASKAINAMDIAEDSCRQRDAMFVVPGGQKLRFQLGDIHSGGAFAGAGFTDRQRSKTSFTAALPRSSGSLPLMAARSALARPRVECASSRVA